MHQRTRNKRRGGTLVFMLGVVFVIIIFSMFFLEMHEIWNYQYSIEARAQRAVNAAVEWAMDDTYRSDGYNYMDVKEAEKVIYEYLNEDLLGIEESNANGGTKKTSRGEKLYSVKYNSVEYLGKFYDGVTKKTLAKGIEVKMTVTMYSNMYLEFGGNGLFTWDSTISSTNFRTDDNMRAGAGL